MTKFQNIIALVGVSIIVGLAASTAAVALSLSQGRQPYENPDRVPLDATTEPF